MAHHHMTPLFAPLYAAVFTSSSFFESLKVHRKLFFIIIILGVATSSSRYTIGVKAIYRSIKDYEQFAERRISQNQLKQTLNALPLKEKTILSTGGIIGLVAAPERAIYQLSDISPRDIKYDFLLLEKIDNHGDIYPLTPENLQRLSEICRSEISQIVLENQFFTLWKGPFTQKCLQFKQMWQLDQNSLIIRNQKS